MLRGPRGGTLATQLFVSHFKQRPYAVGPLAPGPDLDSQKYSISLPTCLMARRGSVSLAAIRTSQAKGSAKGPIYGALPKVRLGWRIAASQTPRMESELQDDWHSRVEPMES